MATVVYDEPPTSKDSSSATAAGRRPIPIWAAIGLALAAGLFVFVVNLRLSLQTSALVGEANAGLPPGTPPPVDPVLSALAIWAPAIIGGFVLLAYVLVGRRLHRRHPRAFRATVIIAGIYIAFSLLNIIGGRITTQAAVALALNGALIALVMLPGSRAYLKAGPQPSP